MDYTTTVPRHLVHRQAVAEVFLTDYTAGSGPLHEVAVQLPLSHRIFDTASGHHDVLGVAEAFRQTVVLLCHSSYGIPLHYRFLMETFGVELLDPLYMQSADAPWTFRVSADNLTHRDGAVSGVQMSGILTDGTHDLARCRAVARGVSVEGYRRIRRGHGDRYPNGRTVPPGAMIVGSALVGRSADRDVLLSTDDARRAVFCTPDPHNYALFDHPVDHVPGMVLFEAGRQAVRYNSGTPHVQVIALSAVFPRFTEWHAPCEVSTTFTGPAESEGSGGSGEGSGMYCVRFTHDQTLTAELELAVKCQ